VGSELCIFDKCLEGLGACVDSVDCELDEFCDPGYGQCFKAADDPNQCIYIPPVGEFAPEVQWHWSGSPQFPTYDQVMMTPIVLNLTDDNGDGVIDEDDIPDVVFTTFRSSRYEYEGALRVVSGDDGRELAVSMEVPFSARADIGAADMDGDGIPEILISNHRYSDPKRLFVLNLVPEGDGYRLALRYTITLSAAFDGAAGLTMPAFADLDGDTTIEAVTQFGIINHDFTLRCERAFHFPVPVDLNGDGVMEIVANGGIYDRNCVELLRPTAGVAAVADLLPDAGPGDLLPEIAFVRGALRTGAVEVWNVTWTESDGWGMTQAWSTPIPLHWGRIAESYPGVDCTTSDNKACNTGGGPPTIADFDGDGLPDIATAARWYYMVLRNDGSVLWADGNTIDYSSAVTGSSVFDFEGDGVAEVVYNDELTLRIYSGPGTGVDADGDGYNDPEVLFAAPNPSGTLYEYPLIVDVDNDGNAEIVVAANNYTQPSGVTGVRVFRDPLDNWVRTRRVWNQHAYHVTNINEDGSVPTPQRANWTVPRLNNFRQNVQPSGVFNAPNLVPGAVSHDHRLCPSGVVLRGVVRNDGSQGIGAGLWVGFYAEDLLGAETRAFLGRAQVATPIPPGRTGLAELEWDFSATLLPSGSAVTLMLPVTVAIVVDDPPAGVGGANGEHNECVETDNVGVGATIPMCPVN